MRSKRTKKVAAPYDVTAPPDPAEIARFLEAQKIKTPWYDNYVAQSKAAIQEVNATQKPESPSCADSATAVKLSVARLRVKEFLAAVGGFDPKYETEADSEVIPDDELQISDFQPWMVRFSKHLNVPAEVSCRIIDFDKLKPWEREAWFHCAALVEARRRKSLVDEKAATQGIGAVVAGQLLAGNDKALLVVEAGLKNVENGKVFRPLAGNQASQADAVAVTVAFYELISEGTVKPAVVEVQKWLRKNSELRYDRKFLSKLLDRLGLGKLKSDARKSYSAAGQRRRGRTHAAHQLD